MTPPDWLGLLARYVSVGGDPDRFWRSTPVEINAEFSGAQMRLEREFDLAAWAAWRPGAVMHGKKYLSLDDFAGRKKKRRRKSAAEIESLIRAWCGGKT